MSLAPVLVSAGVIIEQGRVLVSQRKRGAHLELAWEFPGGKVAAGEDPRDALARELEEELGIQCEIGAAVEVTFHRYPSRDILLLFFEAKRKPSSPDPRVIDVAAFKWAEAAELRDEDFPPADVAVLQQVRRRLK